MNDPENLPPTHEPDPREERLARRSGAPSVPIGLVIGGLILLGAVVYLLSALL